MVDNLNVGFRGFGLDIMNARNVMVFQNVRTVVSGM
jgi:hypothetical protein